MRARLGPAIAGAVACVWLGAGAAGASRSGLGPAPTVATPAPAPRAAPANLGSAQHAADVADYTLRATLDPATHTVHGEGTIGWTNASTRPVRELWLHLYLNAFKNERSAFFRERVGGRGSAPPADWGWIDVHRLALRDGELGAVDLWPEAEVGPSGDGDETEARVPLPRVVAPGEHVTLEVSFDDKLPAVIERTGYLGTFHMVGQWFPKIARLEPDGRWAHFPFHHLSEFYADFGTYDVTLDVPESFTLGATGDLSLSRVADGRRIERHVQRDVHDFAWTAWDRFERLRERVDGVDVVLLYPPGYGRVAQRELAAVRFALPYFSSRYGRYPYDVLTVVHPPRGAEEAGGMEYPTLITTGGRWWTPPGVLAPEIVTVHELGHQWFYGLVATDERSWPMLDEGLDQFAEVDAMEAWRGPGSLVDLAGLRVSDAAVQAVGGDMAVHDEPVAQPADAFSTGADYARLVYSRTASVLETIARVYGRSEVARALGAYTRAHRFAHPGPDDLLAAFRDAAGEPAAAALRTALFDEGWVDYRIDEATTEPARPPAGVFDRDGARRRVEPTDTDAHGWDSTVLVRRRGTLSLPVEVELTFADGSTHRETWDGSGAWKRLAWHGPQPLRSAVVDPDDRVLVDQDLADNRASVGSRRRWAWRVFERATYWMELALQAFAP